jgi:hypothetical protein
MKKIITLITVLLINTIAFAQVPQKMSYQAVVRDGSDALVVSTTIGMQISILQGSSTGTAVYVETQTPSTNANGLVSVEIGTGSVMSGSFSSIDWSTGNYYIKSETDLAGGTSYTISGTSQLLSVPYAMHAGSAAGGLDNGSTAGVSPFWNGTSWVTNNTNFYNNGTNIGIGTTSPTSQLDIVDPTMSRSRYRYGNEPSGLTIGNWLSEAYVYNELNTDLVFGTNNIARVRIKNNGNVGIGTDTPTAKLDVAGTIKIADGTQGAGKVLTSDANGLATWSTPASVAPYYSFAATGFNQQMSFPVGNTTALLMVSMKENCVAAKGAVATIYLDCTTNEVFVLNSSASASLTASGNVMQLNNGCVPMTFTFTVAAGVVTINVSGDTGGIITSKWIVLGI